MRGQTKRKKTKVQKTKLEKAGLEKAGVSFGALRKALKLGQDHAEQGEWDKALPHLLIAWEAMPEDVHLLTLIAHGLARLGVREHALAVLERALSVAEPSEDILCVMLNLAIEMEMYSVAVQVGQQLITLYPSKAQHYVNLATAYTGNKQIDQSIEMLQQVLPLFPDNSDLWNVLATQVRDRDGTEAADVFFEEALRLSPNDLKIISNYAISFVQKGQFEKALELNLRAISVNPDVPEPHVGAAQMLFLKGEMEQGWEHYSYRLDTRRKQNQTQVYTHGIEEWQGQEIEGKTLLVCAEQGIGDEVMFGNYLPFLYDRAEKLIIGCEPRLVSLYRRRFPDAIVDHSVDQFKQGYRYRYFPNVQLQINSGELHVDYAIPLAFAPSFEWRSAAEIKPHLDGFLRPCPERAADYRKRLAEIGPKPKVGIAWRSGVFSQQRDYLYGDIEAYKPLMALSDQVDFVNLQYGDVADELEKFSSLYGVNVHNFGDVNLTADIEANVAIMANLDLVVSSCSAPGMFSLSSGRPTILTSAYAPWWCFGRDDGVAFAKDAEFVVCKEKPDWDDIMHRVAQKASDRLC
ncbi:MAG: tetratricopeptide repeat protein [Kordiimonas sp.]